MTAHSRLVAALRAQADRWYDEAQRLGSPGGDMYEAGRADGLYLAAEDVRVILESPAGGPEVNE